MTVEKTDLFITDYPNVKISRIICEYDNRQYLVNSRDVFTTQRMLERRPFQLTNLKRVKELFSSKNPKKLLFLDVGANLGMNTVEYSSICGTIIAFEPSPFTYQLCCMNVANNETGKVRIAIKHAAVGHKCREIPFKEDMLHLGLSHVGASDIKVDMVTVDSLNLPRLSFMKVDTEGFELYVLKGAKATIEKFRPVVQLELVQDNADTFKYDLQAVYNIFKDMDYKVVSPSGRELANDTHTSSKVMQDRFFVPIEFNSGD